jgi:two-component system sensor histidine kinase TctE
MGSTPREATSLRSTLLRWLLIPTVILLPLSALYAYREGTAIANAAYDRSLLLAARTMAETIRGVDGQLVVDLSYAALDMAESGLGARVFHRITGPDDHLLAGFDDLPPVPGGTGLSPAYPALVHFYDAHYRGLPVRVAALHQPVSEPGFNGMALVQVAETLEARELVTHRLMTQSITRQVLLLALAVALILVAVRRGLAPLDGLRHDAEARTVNDLTPFDERTAPGETRAFVRALNRYVARLAELITLRKRFIENAAHQLRTPIAVLKTQVALAAREDDPQALRDRPGHGRNGRCRRALANQLLSLTRAEHGPVAHREEVDSAALARQVWPRSRAARGGRRHRPRPRRAARRRGHRAGRPGAAAGDADQPARQRAEVRRRRRIHHRAGADRARPGAADRRRQRPRHPAGRAARCTAAFPPPAGPGGAGLGPGPGDRRRDRRAARRHAHPGRSPMAA